MGAAGSAIRFEQLLRFGELAAVDKRFDFGIRVARLLRTAQTAQKQSKQKKMTQCNVDSNVHRTILHFGVSISFLRGNELAYETKYRLKSNSGEALARRRTNPG